MCALFALPQAAAADLFGTLSTFSKVATWIFTVPSPSERERAISLLD